MLQCYSASFRLSCSSSSLKICPHSLLGFHLGSRDWYTVKVKAIHYTPSSIGGVPCLLLDLFKEIFSNVWYSHKWDSDCEFRKMQKDTSTPHFMVVFQVSSEQGKPWKTSVRITNLWSKNWSQDLLHMNHKTETFGGLPCSFHSFTEICDSNVWILSCDFNVLYHHYDIKSILKPFMLSFSTEPFLFSVALLCLKQWAREPVKMAPPPAHCNSSSF